MNVMGLTLATPLGLTAAATQRACAAGISRAALLEDHPHRPTAVRLTSLPDLFNREDRMRALLWRNLAPLAALLPALGDARVPCLLALPEADSTFVLRRWLTGVRGGPKLAGLEISCFEAGRIGFFRCLAAAREVLAETRVPKWVVVGAVDSLVDPATLEALAADGRLLGDRNPDGIIPGEAAGFVVLANTAAVARARTLVLARIAALAEAREPLPAWERGPYTGQALTEVFRALRHHAALRGRRADRVLTCQPGETFWAHEFAAAYLRNAEMMPEPLDHCGLDGSLGEVGSAAGICQLALALHAFAPSPWLRRAPLRRVVLHGASEAGAYAGCLLVHPEVDIHE
ncbi:3-oxoacyl-ACP synthase [Nannocystis punicea]|uniref:3-oxoacyl-ACP synthase n=1 Tax=Nannocystis punicea TaxID=2995304 RepID=A0ABY7HDL8_9BACT|nr:3-oxoacyl-ACP synthase [Nannocystis poenicansa]WAS97363.1 3-oxoacyl-ACP synthase [Nannocystis poenicansa]